MKNNQSQSSQGKIISTVFRILNFMQYKREVIGPDFTDAFPGPCTYSFGPGLVVCTDVSSEFCDAMDALLHRALILPQKANEKQLSEIKQRASVPYPVGTENFDMLDCEYTYLDFTYRVALPKKKPQLPICKLN